MQEWIDTDLSAQLPLIRDRGEGQSIEFKEQYPTNGFELGKEIAAFASTNPGMILIGVSDDGLLVGVPVIEDSKKRDEFVRRIEGVCQGNIRPAITPSVRFAEEEGKLVIIVEVPRGKQPIYYSKNTPYVRHLSSSRPAEPHEVIERVEEWLSTASSSNQDDVADDFYTRMAQALIDVIIFASEADARKVNPWLDLMRAQLQQDGQQLRALSSEDFAIRNNLTDELRTLANELDSVGGHRFYLGGESWRKFKTHIDTALGLASKIKRERFDVHPINPETMSQLRELVTRAYRQLNDLNERTKDLASDGRITRIQEEAARIGGVLLKLSFYDGGNPSSAMEKVREIGRELHLIETERLYLDGGVSVRKILEAVSSATSELAATLKDI